MQRYGFASGAAGRIIPLEIKDGDYVLFSDAQAELAEKDKEIEGLKKSYRELENNYVMQGAIYEGISDLLRDGGTSDFMMSFPIVSQIADLLSEISLKQICIDEARRDAKAEIAALKAENERLRGLCADLIGPDVKKEKE